MPCLGPGWERAILAGCAGAALLLAPVGAAEPDLPAPVPVDVQDDVVYGHKDGLALTLDVVTPREKPRGIGVILVSSGSWRSAKSDRPAEEQARRDKEHWTQGLLQGGYTLFVARHGSAPRYHVPEMVSDIRRAVRFVRLHAADYGVDPERLVITSGSSGGHLALMVGLSGDDGKADSSDQVEQTSCRVAAVVAWFPPTDLVNFGGPLGYQRIEKIRPGFLQSVFGDVDDVEAALRASSPITLVSSDDPPVYLIHGDKDLTVPLQQSELLRDAYRAAGLTAELIVQPGGGHTYWPGILEQYPPIWKWLEGQLGR